MNTWTVGIKKEFGTYNADTIFDENGNSICMVYGIASNHKLEDMSERDAEGLAIARRIAKVPELEARIAALVAAGDGMALALISVDCGDCEALAAWREAKDNKTAA